MARRRKRQSGPLDLIEDLIGPIVALVFLMALAAPALLHAIFGLMAFLAFTVLCGIVAVALFLVIRKLLHKRHEQTDYGSPSPEPYGATRERAWISEAIQKYPQSDWERYGPKPMQEQNLQQRLRAIDWFQFEKVVCAIYEVPGCKVTRLGGANPDGGIDLIAEMGSERLAIQCKHWRNRNVRVHEVREFLGALKDANIEKGVLVTLLGCTEDATALAKRHGIHIVQEVELIGLMQNTDGSLNQRIGLILNDDRKLCPKCEHPLVMRTAKKGPTPGKQFWGYSTYPRCNFKMEYD